MRFAFGAEPEGIKAIVNAMANMLLTDDTLKEKSQCR